MNEKKKKIGEGTIPEEINNNETSVEKKDAF